MKNTFLLFVLCLLFSASHASANTHEIKRVITKQFNVSAGSELDINNKYGNIVINAWNKEVIDFSIEIIGKGDKEKIAQQMADRVSIDFNQTGRRVSAQTNFEQQRNFNCNNCGTTVNYTVNVPASVSSPSSSLIVKFTYSAPAGSVNSPFSGSTLNVTFTSLASFSSGLAFSN